jgi:hypothetical protein
VLGPTPLQFCVQACVYAYVQVWVPRPHSDVVVLGDMKLQGPYYADMLLNVILSHSARWCKSEPRIRRLLKPYNDGRDFVQRARRQLLESLILHDNLVHPNKKVPIVQTLLLLSGQECSYGNRTQAWLYSGMAFRLIEDMGICIDGQKYSGNVRFSIEEIEIRNRLFWSCYFWDKMISLYLGRSPTIQCSSVSPPRIMRKLSSMLFSVTMMDLLINFSG